MTRFSRIPGLALAGILLLLAEFALRLFPLERLLSGIHRMHSVLPAPKLMARWGLVSGVSQVISTLDRRWMFLKPSCLRRALALRMILGDRELLRLGVRWASDHSLQAHAWVGPVSEQERSFQEIAAL